MYKRQLFATLDPTARQLTLPSGLACVAVDTVGFVSRLPHHLVEAFKSTLEEAAYADVLVRVCDASDPDSARQLAVTDEVLESLGCGDIPTVTVYNKCDKAPRAVPLMTDSLRTSAATGEGVGALLAKLDSLLAGRVRRIRVLLPYGKLGEAAPMRQRGTCLLYTSPGAGNKIILEDLRENHFGEFENRSFDELRTCLLYTSRCV